MAFRIEFKTDNAAFADGDGPDEIKRILRIVGDKVMSGQCDGRVWDSNGNTIGEWSCELPAADAEEDTEEDTEEEED